MEEPKIDIQAILNAPSLLTEEDVRMFDVDLPPAPTPQESTSAKKPDKKRRRTAAEDWAVYALHHFQRGRAWTETEADVEKMWGRKLGRR